MIRYYCKTTRSNRTYNFPLSLIYDRIKINSVPFHRSVSLHRETTRREFIYFKLARFLSTYMFHYLLFEEDIRLRPILFINHLGISRLKLYEWDETLERTRLRVFIRSLSPFIVWPRSRSLVPGERPSQLRATVRHSFFPSVSCFGSLLDKQKQSTKNFLPVARRWTTSTTVVCLWPATSNRFV